MTNKRLEQMRERLTKAITLNEGDVSHYYALYFGVEYLLSLIPPSSTAKEAAIKLADELTELSCDEVVDAGDTEFPVLSRKKVLPVLESAITSAVAVEKGKREELEKALDRAIDMIYNLGDEENECPSGENLDFNECKQDCRAHLRSIFTTKALEGKGR